MSIDIHSENLRPLKEALARLPGKPHLSTGWRWAMKGIRGIRLETCVIGGHRYTSDEAVQRFVDATTAAHNAGAASPAVPIDETLRKRRAAIKRAERELAEAGIPPPHHAANREPSVEKCRPP